MKKILISVILLFILCWILTSCSDADCKHEQITVKTIDADCDHEGYTLNRCKDCNLEFRTELIPPKGHTLSQTVTTPTCTEQGYTTFSCDCGYTYNASYVAPLNHTFSSELILPTCTEQGYTAMRCTVCRAEQKDNFVAPLGHRYKEKTVAPTCTENGFTTFSCIVCTDSYIGRFVAATGHTFSQKVTLPTSSRVGSTEYTCHCSYSYVGDYIFPFDRFFGAYVGNDQALANGIDVSKWNGEIDWDQIKAAGVDFVILKAGSTGFGMDPTFETNYAGAKAAGLAVGAYYYSYAMTVEEMLSDAHELMGYLKGKQFEYPIYLDMEDPSQRELSKTLLTDMCAAFLECLQENGYFSALYTNYDWLFNLLDTTKITTLYDVWLARWRLDGQPNWSASYDHPRTGMWQYTDSGNINGHDCTFDLNIAFKDYPALIKQWGYNGFELK